MLDSKIPQKLQAKLKEELREEERVLWSGRPKPVYFTPNIEDIFGFGLQWTTFTLSFAAFGLFTGAPPMFRIGSIIFLLAGVGMLSAPLIMHWLLLHTAYVITDRRAIVIQSWLRTEIKSIQGIRLKNVFRRQYRDGTSDLIIDREAKHDSDSGKFMNDVSFDRIADGQKVERLLNSLASGLEAEQEVATSSVPYKANTRLDSNIPPDLQDIVYAELDKDEAVAWSAMPPPIFFTKSARLWYWIGLPAMLFCAICAVMLAYISGSFSDDRVDYNFLVLEGSFLCATGAILWIPVMAYRKTRRIAYVITNRRAILLEVSSSVTIRSFTAERLRDRTRKDYKDGTSDIIINFTPWRDPDGDWSKPQLGFFRIKDADYLQLRLDAMVQQAELVSV